MAEFRIDRLKFNWKGDWQYRKPYRKDDVVYYGGNTYVCLQAHESDGNNFYDDIIPASTTITQIVTVGTDSINGSSHGVFYISGEENPELNLLKGRTYVFNQDDSSNKEFNNEIHPLLISNVVDGTSAGGYTYDVNVTYYIDNVEVASETEYLAQFANSNFRKIEITVPESAPRKLFYFSTSNTGMGNEINVRYSSYWEIMFDGYVWKGDWSRSTRYNLNDIIKYNGYIYQCLTEHTSTSDINLNFIDQQVNWTVYTKGYNWRDVWTVETIYNQGDVVTYNGIAYECITSHQSASDTGLGLEDDSAKWQIITRSDNWITEWAIDTRYRNDDIVRYGGRIYRCTSGHTSANSPSGGLEADLNNWEVVVDGIDYKGDFTPSFRYKTGDVVRYGHSLWKCNLGHTSSATLRENENNWNIYVLGLGYEELWNELTEYKIGDIVLHGGYTYTALTNNAGSVPSAQGISQNTGDWELLTTGYKMQGDWDSGTSYYTGDVVRVNGYLYITTDDNSNNHPDLGTPWQLLIPKNQYRSQWLDDAEYALGDVVVYAGTTYICINRHTAIASDSRPDLDQDYTQEDFWQILIQGTPSNVLTNLGDLKVHDTAGTTNLAIGTAGKVLKSDGANPSWQDYDIVPKVYYVGTYGLDDPSAGKTLAAPFRTVKYALDYLAEDAESRTPATLFVKTGLYEEELPMSIPRDVAVVGDELRSTVIQPASGYETENMFYVNNGSGLRNMTLQGLYGTLGDANEYLTKRPSAGAFVSLDPGLGATDSSVWITNKSPYIQNVSTFGTGCIGMKIDGSLHNSGNKSIVANDFTQICSDGIGYWASNGGRSELVSVFTYYCHIGYLATDGGILRATNGNNSYGEYGSVAEGFDTDETPINGAVNNKDNKAQVSEIITYGTTTQQILSLGYSHAGQDYSTANITFSGSGFGASGSYPEIRNGAVSNIRMIDPGDSSIPGGFDYQFVSNSAQEGTTGTITLAAADVGTAAKYVGMRIVIQSGKGVGQYGEITGFNEVSKVAIVSREYDGGQGWDHFLPGWPIETTLDETTVYSIEPKVTATEPPFTTSEINSGTSADWDIIKSANGVIIAATAGDNPTTFLRSIDNGSNWTAQTENYQVESLVYAGADTWIAGTTSTDTILKSTDNGANWSTQTVTGLSSAITAAASDGTNVVIVGNGIGAYSADNGTNWNTITGIASISNPVDAAYGNGYFIIINRNTTYSYSTDDGATFTTTAFPSSVTNTANARVAYGASKFSMIGADADSSEYVTASFFNPTEGWNVEISQNEYLNVAYGNGVFLATTAAGVVGLSQSGSNYKVFREDSSANALDNDGIYVGATYHVDKWILTKLASDHFAVVQTGATPILRAKVSGSRVSDILVYDPGSYYSTAPAITVFDPENTAEAVYSIYLNDGVLPQPVMSNRGAGFVTATATITGDGLADIYQVGNTLKLTNVSAVPGVGANLEINGINDARYSVALINDVVGTGPYSMTLTITPSLGVSEAPNHEESIIIRERYSQIRLTGHDFLDIGTGNQSSTRYPTLYLEGETAENEAKPFNETVANGGGRVFYTSTDQDGNFRVGELFQVEQARGVVTISASQFNLSGLEEISLGGIQVGGSAVVIREFSKDATFIANSDNIVPTEAAIKRYVESRISGGGSNASTNTLIAGQIQITQTNISSNSGLPIQITPVVNFTGGYTGSLLAQQYFSFGVNTQFDEIS